MNDALIIDMINKLIRGSNIEVYCIYDYSNEEQNGLEFDLFNQFNKITDFESDIECLLNELDTRLEKNMIISHEYSEETSRSGIDGVEYPDYHCYVRIYEKL